MKFNNPVNDQAIWAIIKNELGVDGKAAHELSKQISQALKRSCESALRMDRVELRAELELELKEKYEKREATLKKREEAGGGLTREELITLLADNIADEDGKINTQAATLLTKLEGFEAAMQDVEVTLIDFKDAPDYYRTKIPEGLE